ncbi:MAG: DUF4127 family protein [Bacilli bacterium]|nr:DUF4127 family protein [Bacilli bacterium]
MDPIEMQRRQQQLLEQKRLKQQARRQAIKRARKRKWVKVAIFILVFVLVFVFYEQGFHIEFNQEGSGFQMPKIKFEMPKWDFKMPSFHFFSKEKKKDSSEGNYDSELPGKLVAYVPMDDRPIHKTRIAYLADSFGMKLKMPDTKYIKTYLTTGDNSYAGYSTKYGNPDKVAKWLEEQEEAGCDYYILSLDQMYSGGLVGSQYLSDDDIKVYGKGVDASNNILITLMKDSQNHIYLIDSVVGLTVTPGFMDFTGEDAVLLRNYTAVPRKSLKGADLTIKKIAEAYSSDENGNPIETTLDSTKLEKYLAARKRKLTITKNIITMIEESKNPNIHLYYGIDDSGNPTSIQANDISYIRSLAMKKEMVIPIQDGASSMSEFVFADLLLDSVSRKPNVKVTYYGDPNQVVVGSTDTYGSYMSTLLSDLDVGNVEKDEDLEILVYCKTVPELREATANQLLTHYLKNIHNHVPTVIVNDADYLEDHFLINNLSNYDATHIPMTYLIGYSNWNGYIHSSKIGLTEGLTRYLFLASKRDSDDCDRGYLKVMAESFLEDMGYLTLPVKDTIEPGLVEQNTELMRTRIIANFQKGNYISGIDKYAENGIRSIGFYNYYFPWSRPDDLDFDVSATLIETRPITIPTEVQYQIKEA